MVDMWWGNKPTEFQIQTTLFIIPAGQLNFNLQAHKRQDNYNLNLNQSAFHVRH